MGLQLQCNMRPGLSMEFSTESSCVDTDHGVSRMFNCRYLCRIETLEMLFVWPGITCFCMYVRKCISIVWGLHKTHEFCQWIGGANADWGCGTRGSSSQHACLSSILTLLISRPCLPCHASCTSQQNASDKVSVYIKIFQRVVYNVSILYCLYNSYVNNLLYSSIMRYILEENKRIMQLWRIHHEFAMKFRQFIVSIW